MKVKNMKWLTLKVMVQLMNVVGLYSRDTLVLVLLLAVHTHDFTNKLKVDRGDGSFRGTYNKTTIFHPISVAK